MLRLSTFSPHLFVKTNGKLMPFQIPRGTMKNLKKTFLNHMEHNLTNAKYSFLIVTEEELSTFSRNSEIAKDTKNTSSTRTGYYPIIDAPVTNSSLIDTPIIDVPGPVSEMSEIQPSQQSQQQQSQSALSPLPCSHLLCTKGYCNHSVGLKTPPSTLAKKISFEEEHPIISGIFSGIFAIVGALMLVAAGGVGMLLLLFSNMYH